MELMHSLISNGKKRYFCNDQTISSSADTFLVAIRSLGAADRVSGKP